MITEFFKEQQSVLLDRNNDIDSRLDVIHTKKIENQKFIELLKKEGSSVLFSDFSPRTVSNKNVSKINELEEEMENLLLEEKSLIKEKEENVAAITRFDDCLDEYRKLKKMEMKYNGLEIEYSDLLNKVNSSNDDPVTDDYKDYLSKSISNIVEYLPAAPLRAKNSLIKLQKELTHE